MSGAFSPIDCPLSRVAPIEGADRIRRAEASGYVVVVGANRVDGETGVLFPAGGCLHPEFVKAAALTHLEANGRVKEIRLRGVRSEGLWLSMDEVSAALDRVNSPVWSLPLGEYNDGHLNITIGGAPLFEKYVPRTRYACGERVIKPPMDPRVTRVCRVHHMPQARPELQAKFTDESEAREVLEGAGFVLLPDFTWRAPEGRGPCIEELDAIEYLTLEWDFGGLVAR